MCHWNMGSAKLANKMNEVLLAIREINPSVFGISEANLDSGEGYKEVEIEGYDLIFTKMMSEPTMKYSRLVTYIKKSLEYKIREDLMSKHCSTVWLEIRGPNRKRWKPTKCTGGG